MRRLIAVTLCLVGCGGAVGIGATQQGVGVCMARTGWYELRMSPRSAACQFHGGVVVADSWGGDGCTGGNSLSADNCTNTVGASCAATCPSNSPAPGPNSTLESGSIAWTADGSAGTGTITLAPGTAGGCWLDAGPCVYDVTYTKL